MLNVEELASQAQQIATQLGITKFDVYGATVDESSVQVDQGEPKQVEASSRSSVTVRVWNQAGTVGITSTTDVDAIGLELALKTAQEASAFGAKEYIPDFSPEATKPIPPWPDPKAPPVPIDRLVTTLLAAEKQLLEAHPAIVSVPYNGLSQQAIDRFYFNSEGAQRQESNTYTSLYLYSKTEVAGKKPRSAGGFRIGRSLDTLPIDDCLQEVIEKTISHLDYEKIPSGKYRVVFSPEAFLSLLGAFSNLFNAQSILDKQSLSTPESLGQTIASPLLSVNDDALHPDNITVSHFDGEGTPTRCVPLIQNGVLTSFLHSAGTAKRLNAQPTGNANMGAKVTVSPHFFHVFSQAPADTTYDLATADNVVLIDDLHALHAGVSALEGSFSLPFDGWLVRNGQRTSIEAATVAGDFRQLLQSIIYVAPKAEVKPNGICPYIWVDALAITSE